jgi:hypothetical protein
LKASVSRPEKLLLFLGKGRPINELIGSTFLAVSILFYINLVGSYFKIHIFFLSDRLIYNTHFRASMVNEITDNLLITFTVAIWALVCHRSTIVILSLMFCLSGNIIAVFMSNTVYQNFLAVVTLPIIIASTLFNNFNSHRIIDRIKSSLFFNYFGIIIIILCLFSVVLSVLTMYSVPHSEWDTDIVYRIFVLGSASAPILMGIVLFAVPIKVIINTIPIMRNKFVYIIPISTHETNPKIIMLSIAVILAVIIAFIPHLGRGMDFQAIGVDTSYYAKWVGALFSSDNVYDYLSEAFMVQSNGDRPFVLILIHFLATVTKLNLTDLIEYWPVLLAPSLSIVIFFLTKEITSDERASLLASIISAVSFQTLVGIYAGFYANWFALLFGYSSIIFAVRFIKYRKNINLIFFFVLYLALAFAHVYTLFIITIVLIPFLVLKIKSVEKSRKDIILIILVILLIVASMIVKNVITSPRVFLADKIPGMIGINNFSDRLGILYDAVQTYYGSQLSNFLILAVGVIWIFLFNTKGLDSKLICIFLSLGAATLFFGGWAVQSRVIYDIPFQIIAGSTLAWLSRQVLFKPWAAITMVWLTAMAIRSVSNFYLEPQSLFLPT